MSTTVDILKEESTLGRWPRRLLHVETLTSHEWSPGNRYGSAIEPAYAAITYTWGRWRLKDDEMSKVKAIPVKNVPWKISRVTPDLHFSVQELEAVINRASDPPPQTTSSAASAEHVGFVWLDVACIDQRENHPKAASEMGRQANTFRCPAYVYAWLTSLSQQSLDDIFRFLTTNKERHGPQSAIGLLSKLTSDPWFSSLWTLQESFLRTDAFFLFRNAQIAVPPTTKSLQKSDAPLFHAALCLLLFQQVETVWRLSTSEVVVAFAASGIRAGDCSRRQDRAVFFIPWEPHCDFDPRPEADGRARRRQDLWHPANLQSALGQDCTRMEWSHLFPEGFGG